MTTMKRRTLLGLGTATAVTTLTGLAQPAQAQAQGDYKLIRGGRVLTLDPQLGELDRADVLIQGSQIVNIAANLNLPGPGEILEAEGMIVAPGLVDNHRHLWGTLLRGFSADHTFNDYRSQVLLSISPHLTTDDVYIGCLLGAYEALNSGVTTILDWNHGANTLNHAFAAVTALRDSGIRGLFGYSSPASDNLRADAPPTVADLDAVYGMVEYDPRVGMAIATRNPEWADAAGLARIVDDVAQARRLGVPVTLHTGFGGGISAPQWMASEGLLGPDVTLIHGIAFTPADLALIASAGAWMSVSPDTEMQMEMGAPPLRAMLDAGVSPTVSVDVVTASDGDLRVQLRMLLQNQRWRDFADGHSGPMLSYASTLPYVTSNAAASLGLGDEIGRLAPGRKADIILINTADPALAPATDAVLALLTAPASAIDTVLVDGHVVKRNGALNAGNLGWLRDAARQARNRLLSSV